MDWKLLKRMEGTKDRDEYVIGNSKGFDGVCITRYGESYPIPREVLLTIVSEEIDKLTELSDHPEGMEMIVDRLSKPDPSKLADTTKGIEGIADRLSKPKMSYENEEAKGLWPQY